jgi:thiol-disulfide isomerase/thioredoxin
MVTQLAFSKIITIPKMEIYNLNEKSVSIEANKDIVVVINFWAEWCTSCIKEIPELNKLVDEFKGKKIRFYAINAGDKRKRIDRFLRKNPFSFQILLDKNKKFSKEMGVTSLPQTYVIKNNQIIYHGFTPPKSDILNNAIN